MVEDQPGNSGRDTFSVLAVIVLYNVEPSKSSAFESLMRAVRGLEPPSPEIRSDSLTILREGAIQVLCQRAFSMSRHSRMWASPES